MRACQETTVCHEATEADIEKIERDSGMMQSVAAHPDIPKEDAARMAVGEPRKRHRDQNLAAQRHQKKEQKQSQRKNGCRRNLLTKETRGYCGSQKSVIVVYRKMPRHATMAWRKRHIRSTVERTTQRVGRLRKNLQSRQESGNATKDLGGKPQLYPEKRKTTGIDIGGWSSGQLSPLRRGGPTYKILKMTLELEFANQADGMPSGLQRSKHWTLWRGKPPPKRKNKQR
jgi:hypothetical protein